MLNLDEDIRLAEDVWFRTDKTEDDMTITVKTPFILSSVEYAKGQEISRSEFRRISKNVIARERALGIERGG